MTKYCVNCEEGFNPAAGLANSPDNSDFCSKECEEAFIASADKTTLELVRGVNPEIRPAQLESHPMSKTSLSNSKATDILSNSKVVDAKSDTKESAITEEARKAIENLLNTGQK